MRKSRFTEAQIVAIVREYCAGMAVGEFSRKRGVHAKASSGPDETPRVTNRHI